MVIIEKNLNENDPSFFLFRFFFYLLLRFVDENKDFDLNDENNTLKENNLTMNLVLLTLMIVQNQNQI